ncbi:TetR family transcriptional regulator [Novosphingobium sp. PC22D]|uniref:TetR/AcrR family transcriptional regulator n=1 Tax=Novosphingobium sp. PC22D TaxID=1962403 RepID=UPI000BF22BEC|nr:TetR/AcrR family transcriptional regulator [Novosphingobium sp. PC22D]PEQ14531.1 TetR family transcriptional regulator [Novosphingobium sp. PC22D]
MAGQITDTKLEAPTDARQVRSRKALNAALLALLEERSFDQLTIREITARAGTGYATFFRHYPDKEALLNDVASEQIAELLAMAVPILQVEADSYRSTLALCAYVEEHRKLWTALLTGGAAAIVRAEFIRLARKLDTSLVMQHEWLPSDLGVVYGTGGTVDVLAWWLTQDEAIPAERIADILHRLVIDPLVGNPARLSGTPG